MSSALVHQALEFVDPQDCDGKHKKRRSGRQKGSLGQDHHNPYKRNKKLPQSDSKVNRAEENIKKLLALSTPATESKITEKIIERAIKGKPLLEKIEVKKETEKSILFPDEPIEEVKNEEFSS